ncbi:MAG TPA: hypothetical protein VGZ26_12945 [Pirellulales bacterium]|nr:hypothetical protein [Pirellulales bacterium]
MFKDHFSQEYATLQEATEDRLIVPAPASLDVLTEVLRSGAQSLLTEAIDAEVAQWIESRSHVTNEAGHRQVVRNGRLPKRTILTGLGPLEGE